MDVESRRQSSEALPLHPGRGQPRGSGARAGWSHSWL